MRRSCVGALAAVVSFAAAPGIAREDPWVGRFTKEAPRAWDAYRRLARRLQGTVTWSLFRVGPGSRELGFKHVYEVKQNAECASYLDQAVEDRARAGVARALNPQYRFSLKRGSADGQWKVTDVELPYKEAEEYDPVGPKEMVAAFTDAPLRIWTNPLAALPEFVQLPGFKVLSATAVRRAGRELVRFDFTSRPQRATGLAVNGRKGFGTLIVSGGWVLLDPDRYWLIQEYGLTATNLAATQSGQRAGSMTYKEGQDPFPIVSRVSVTAGDGVKAASESLYEYDLKPRDVPNREFTLSAFGLPEPAGARLPTPWYLWALGCSVLCFMMAIAFHRFSRKPIGFSR
jgi:hypothetical protein